MKNIVFLFDVDNTLLENDSVTEDLKAFLEKEVGEKRNKRYWEIFEDLRNKLGYADYLGALQITVSNIRMIRICSPFQLISSIIHLKIVFIRTRLEFCRIVKNSESRDFN